MYERGGQAGEGGGKRFRRAAMAAAEQCTYCRGVTQLASLSCVTCTCSHWTLQVALPLSLAEIGERLRAGYYHQREAVARDIQVRMTTRLYKHHDRGFQWC